MNLAQILIHKGLVKPEDLDEAAELRKLENLRLEVALVRLGLLKEDMLLKIISEEFHIPRVDVTSAEVDAEVIRLLPRKLVYRKNLLPLSRENGKLRIATNDPFDLYAFDEVRLLTGLEVAPVLAGEEDIRKVIRAHYGVGGDTIDEMMSTDDLSVVGDASEQAENILEMAQDAEVGTLLGYTQETPAITWQDEQVLLDELLLAYDSKLEGVYPVGAADKGKPAPIAQPQKRTAKGVHIAKPRVIIPAFPGTNSEVDSARAFLKAGADAQVFLIRNLTGDAVAQSIRELADAITAAQMLFIPGGFSGGDEPDGSGKFITAFFRSPAILDAVSELLNVRDGLIGGVCNGFQALIKLGLLPYGEIREPDPGAPTLTFNRIGRHQSRIVRTRVASNLSPWLMRAKVGDIHSAPISHGEGRFIASEPMIRMLADGGQIATQYVDDNGAPTMDIDFNPSGSTAAIEGITSPDGRVFGRMAHSERVGKFLYKNVPGDYESRIFRGAVDYFQ